MDAVLRRVRQYRWLITGGLAAGILLLSLLPDPPRIDLGVSYTDKIGHFAAYLVFGFMLLLCAAWRGAGAGRSPDAGTARRPHVRPGIPPLAAAVVVVLVAVCYGGAIELLQHFTGRDTEILDVAADLAGAVAGSAVGLLSVLRRRSDRRPGEP
jgi:VanZ family protein